MCYETMHELELLNIELNREDDPDVFDRVMCCLSLWWLSCKDMEGHMRPPKAIYPHEECTPPRE